MTYSKEQLMQIDAVVGERHGWDFSRVRDGRDPVPWDYVDVVRQYLKPDDDMLDVGTGGGEVFLSLAGHFGSGHGTDVGEEMIAAAQLNRKTRQITNVEFSVMPAERLTFADDTFDVVLNRHSVIHVGEVLRVLRPGGYFITQSIGHRNTQVIFAAYDWTIADLADEFWLPLPQVAEQFQQQGSAVRAIAEYDVPYWFEDVESLVFWLKAVPLPEPFDMNKHWQGVNRIIKTCTTSRGIETNEHRELLVVQKQ